MVSTSPVEFQFAGEIMFVFLIDFNDISQLPAELYRTFVDGRHFTSYVTAQLLHVIRTSRPSSTVRREIHLVLLSDFTLLWMIRTLSLRSPGVDTQSFFIIAAVFSAVRGGEEKQISFSAFFSRVVK